MQIAGIELRRRYAARGTAARADAVSEPFVRAEEERLVLAVVNLGDRDRATGEQNLKALSDAGCNTEWERIPVFPGRFAGYFEHVEMEQMVEAGLTPMQVIVASTKSGAEFLKAKDLGTLEANKWANLIVLGANPLDNIRNKRSIESVYIDGNKIR